MDSSNRNYYTILKLKTTLEGTFCACVMVAFEAQKKYDHIDFQILSFVVEGLLFQVGCSSHQFTKGKAVVRQVQRELTTCIMGSHTDSHPT